MTPRNVRTTVSHTTVQLPAGQFPPEPTAFVGRVTELERLGEALAASRLVTVTGPGGVGKTRLARRAAAGAGSRFPDGVRLVELSALRDPELLANTVSAGLGLNEHDPRGRLEQVLDYLRERRVLLVLDTCEHLVEACALFAEAVLARTSHVTILATSRQPLLVAGEHDFQLSPFGAGDEAVDLFAQRAATAGCAVTEADRAEVTRVCARLDGVPLAIELAAGRLRDLTLGGLAKRLDGEFLDAAAGQDGAAGRHRTLRDAIGWSYELCTPEERVLWERLSVFAGPVGADAAGQVCAGRGLDREAAMRTVFGLVDKSVLIRADAGGGSRYGMLDTVREYGAGRLAASGAGEQVRARHLRRYLALAEEFSANPLERQVPRYMALRAEHADIRAALEYAATVGDAGAGHPALRLPADLEWYWMISSRFQEARHWLTRGLDRVPDGPDRARALFTRCVLAVYQGDAQPALADSEEGLALADDIGDRRLRARALAYRAYALITVSRFEEVKKTAEEAEALFGPGRREGAQTLLDLAKVYAYLLTGDLEGGLRQCERTLRLISADSGERWASGFLHALAGLAMSFLGQPDEGNRAALRGLAMKYELFDTAGMAQCLGFAALVSAAQRRSERTAWMIGAMDTLCEQFGNPFGGVDMMQAFKEQAAQDARTKLGGDRYDDVIRDVKSRPLDEIIDMAVRDLDTMPALPPATRSKARY